MRIAVLTNAYPPQARGGAGRIAERQVELLRARGHEVRVWVTSLDWTTSSFIGRLFFHVRDLVWIHPAAKEIVAWQPEVLLTHNLTGAGFRTPQKIKQDNQSITSGKNLRWAHVLHDVQLFHPLGLLKEEQRITGLQRWVTSVRRQIFGRPDAVISPTEWLLQAHRRRGWFEATETKVIPNLAPALESPASQDWNKPLRILFVGRVSPDKGSELLKQLMQTVSRPTSWEVIGAQATSLNETIVPSGSVLRLQEESSPNEVLEAMRAADLLLVPSQIAENQPTVLLEAFAVGLPVIGQAIGGIPETIGTAGIIVDTAEPQAWLKAIDKLTSRPRVFWSERVQQAWTRHDPTRVVEVLEDALRSNKKI